MALSFRLFDDSSLYKRFSVMFVCKHVELLTGVANEISDSFVDTQVLILDL